MSGDLITTVGIVLALLAALGAAAAYLAVGTQKGRIQRLEDTNADLRKEVDDEKRRHDTTRTELHAERTERERDTRVIEHLQAEVATMREVFTAVNGPIAALAAAMKADHDLLASHHREAMRGLNRLTARQVDTLRLLGDKREHDPEPMDTDLEGGGDADQH